MIVVDPTILQLAIATVLPLLVGIFTTKVAHPGVKAVALAFLSAATAVGVAALQAGGVVAGDVVIEAFQNFVVAVAVYYGVWKPTTVSGAVQDKTKNIGITIKEG